MIQRMFVTLDTKKTNYKNVGKINHGDDLILELTVLSDGDMISFNDPMVDLLVKKSDGKMIRQNSGIEHIKPNKFVIEVMKDCVTSPGLSTNQLVINDNGRISTCMFYYTILNSLEEDIIQSISNVEVLEQLDEFTIQMKDKMENFDEELQNRMSELEDAIDDLAEFFGDTGVDLLEAELRRNEAEQTRAQAESVRVQNESRRLQNDLDLANAEAERVRAENIRIQNEADRALVDAVMDQKESKREDSELERIQNESKRITDEVVRQQNENTRQSNESIRMSNETDRKTQENRRVTAETNRVNAETTRRNNENSRISNETERQKAMNEMKSLLEDARGFNDRVGDIEDEIEEINSSLDNIAINPKKYGAFGDGSLHLISEKFSRLESAINYFGFEVDLNDSLDWASIQYCLNNFTNVMLPEGEYIINKPLYIRSLTTLRGVNKGKVEIRKITNDMFVPNTFNRYSKLMGFDFNDDFLQDSLLICYHDNDKPSQSVIISNLSLKGITSEQDVNYAIYCPMSSQLTIDNVITRNFKTSFYTNDSWTVKFNNYEIKYSDYGVIFDISPLNTSHYWCGTSIDSNNLILTECKNGIKLTHVAYSSFNTITYDNSNNVCTVLELSNCNGIIINALGVEHVKVDDSLFKILNNCRGITINNLTFESGVVGSANLNTEIFKVEKSKLILNNPSLTLSSFNNSSTFNVTDNSTLVFNDGNDFDYRKGKIDDTSKVIKNTNNIFTTTSDLDIYVDLSNGDDIIGTGYSANPFRTIKKALSIIPHVINHNITLRLAGNHTDTIKLNGLVGCGKITIDKISGRGCEIIALNCIDIKNCIVPIYINNIQFNSNNNSNAITITLENNNKVSFNSCNVVNNQYRTVYCDNTNLSYENSQLTCGERLFDIKNMSNVFLGSLNFGTPNKITVNSSILYTYLVDVSGVEKYRGGQMFSE